MTKVLVLGLGNDLLTDDAIGLRVAQEVRHRVAGDPRIEVSETAEVGLALLDLIVDHECLLVVDSIKTGQHPAGFILELEPKDFPEHSSRFPHAIGIERLCALGRIRGLPAPGRVRIFAIEVADPFTLGTDITPEVEQVIDDAADLVMERAMEFASTSVAAPG